MLFLVLLQSKLSFKETFNKMKHTLFCPSPSFSTKKAVSLIQVATISFLSQQEAPMSWDTTRSVRLLPGPCRRTVDAEPLVALAARVERPLAELAGHAERPLVVLAERPLAGLAERPLAGLAVRPLVARAEPPLVARAEQIANCLTSITWFLG